MIDLEKQIERFKKILDKKFLATYPDVFIKCLTRDAEVYKASNGCMYSWYIFILNKFVPYNLSPEYSQTMEEIIESDWSCVERFVDDFEKDENWERFLFKNISI